MADTENQAPPPEPTPKKASAKKVAEPVAEPVAAPSTGGNNTAAATAAVSNTFNVVREKLQAGEQMALSGAALIALVWVVFDLIFDDRTVSSFTLLIAVLTILAIWVHRWGQHDFGNSYRIIIGALGLALALFAVTNFLLVIRTGINASAIQLLGLLLFWVGGVVAGYGAWLVFRTREE
jgi:hypothetical protein